MIDRRTQLRLDNQAHTIRVLQSSNAQLVTFARALLQHVDVPEGIEVPHCLHEPSVQAIDPGGVN